MEEEALAQMTLFEQKQKTQMGRGNHRKVYPVSRLHFPPSLPSLLSPSLPVFPSSLLSLLPYYFHSSSLPSLLPPSLPPFIPSFYSSLLLPSPLPSFLFFLIKSSLLVYVRLGFLKSPKTSLCQERWCLRVNRAPSGKPKVGHSFMRTEELKQSISLWLPQPLDFTWGNSIWASQCP